MLSFKNDFFFVKFSVLFFIVTIFGYWGIDLNSEELYIAFSFFFLVIVAFGAIRVSTLLFFLNTVNRKYSRLLLDLNRIRLILAIRNKTFETLLSTKQFISTRIFKFLTFSSTFVPALLKLKSSVYFVNGNKFFVSLVLNLNFFVLNTTRIRRFSGFFENSSRFFSVTV